MRGWFARDVAQRARLAVDGSSPGLAQAVRRGNLADLLDRLGVITRDDRILGAAAYSADASLLASTPAYPSGVLGPEAAARGRGPWNLSVDLPGGEVFVNAIPLADAQGHMGTIVLVHDMSFVERRDTTMRLGLLLAFGVLAAAASAVTMVASRLSWRRWSIEIRKFLSGGGPAPEFRPILQDVRDLVGRIAAEKDAEGTGGIWTPQRLKQTLLRHLHGERVVVVANREPYIHSRDRDGRVAVLHPASGLVTAVEPVLRACSGVWVAHGGGSADRETSDTRGRIRVPPGEESYLLRRVWLSPEEEKGYYYGFSNEGLWPLCHIAHTRPLFRTSDFAHYQAVNRRFADAVIQEADSEDPIILVQDYHFALAPQMIRERLPRATIITFWHIPWPNSERFGICPWRDELLSGLLGASIVGFHTRVHCNNFVDSVDRYLEARIDREQNAVVQKRRSTLVRPYPISLEWPSRWSNTAPSPPECRASVLAEL